MTLQCWSNYVLETAAMTKRKERQLEVAGMRMGSPSLEGTNNDNMKICSKPYCKAPPGEY